MIQVILEGKKKTPTGGICHPPPMDVSVQTRNRPESCCCATYDCSFDTALYQTPQFSHKCRSVKIIYFMSCISDSYSLTPTWERGRPARPGAAGGRSNGLRPRCGRDARAPRVALPLQKMPNLQSPATGGRFRRESSSSSSSSSSKKSRVRRRGRRIIIVRRGAANEALVRPQPLTLPLPSSNVF